MSTLTLPVDHTATVADLPDSRLRPADLARLATSGLRARPVRAILSALGITIGIAAMVAVLGIASSSQARLDQQLASLGTNLLTARSGTDPYGQPLPLPTQALGRLSVAPGVQSATSLAELHVNVYRNNRIDPAATSGIAVAAADENLPRVLNIGMQTGTWFNRATSAYPTVVLGSEAAHRLGVDQIGSQIWLGGQHVTVVGILERAALAPDLDSAALIGEPFAARAFGYDGHPSQLLLRADDAQVLEVRDRLAPTIDPENPTSATVGRPSDALAAKSAAQGAYTSLLLGLGGVALLVGGIGVANTMIISVLERRREIGLRRALGATTAHIRVQFLAESLTLSLLGGLAGAALGTAITAMAATVNNWPLALTPTTLATAIAATLAVGAIAGFYPATRAARTPPTAAMSS